MEDEDYDNSCLICLQTVTQTSKEHFNSLKSFYNYIKFHNEIKVVFVCEKCGAKLTKFAKLINILEKTRLEMDYILDFIQSTIKHSSKFKVESPDFASIRECILEKCKSINCSQKAEIILQKIDQLNRIKRETSPSECSDDWSPNGEDVNGLSESNCDQKISEIPEVNGQGKSLEDTKITKGGRKPTSKSKKCEKCSKFFSSSKNLRIHINAVHLNLKPYLCNICSKSFARRGELIRHSGRPHKTKQNLNSESLPCEICNKSFDNLRSLFVHKKYVHRERNFQCEICKKAFKTVSSLKLHVASVHEKERHSCQVEGCDTSYAQSSLLIYHYRRKHPDFQIPPKSHPDKSYFKKTENGKIVVECKICGCQFETANKVMKHIKRKHSPKTFLCEECGYATPFSDKLTRHVKEVHLGLNKREVVRKSIDKSV